jgi:hypothetical protein
VSSTPATSTPTQGSQDTRAAGTTINDHTNAVKTLTTQLAHLTKHPDQLTVTRLTEIADQLQARLSAAMGAYNPPVADNATPDARSQHLQANHKAWAMWRRCAQHPAIEKELLHRLACTHTTATPERRTQLDDRSHLLAAAIHSTDSSSRILLDLHTIAIRGRHRLVELPTWAAHALADAWQQPETPVVATHIETHPTPATASELETALTLWNPEQPDSTYASLTAAINAARALAQ